METETIVESVAPPEIQEKAEKMGWIPPVRYKGPAERFVDADAYIERGEIVIPIIKKQLQDTKAELERARLEGVTSAEALKKLQASVDAIEERHSVEKQRAVENARAEVKAQLAKASEAGDHEAVAELTDQLTSLKAEEKKPAEEKKTEVKAAEPDPVLLEWVKENEWYGKNIRLTQLAFGIAQELRRDGNKLIGRDFYDKVAEEMEQYLPEKKAAADKVEGARNGSDGESRGAGKKGYANLTTEQKLACNADIKRFVGEGKKYKTDADYRANWAAIYFSQE